MFTGVENKLIKCRKDHIIWRFNIYYNYIYIYEKNYCKN